MIEGQMNTEIPKVLLISMKSFRKSFGTMKNDSKWLGPGSTRSRDAKASS